jgi:hypothetical protein
MAARTLLAAGMEPLVLEARDRVGGRTWTRPASDGTALRQLLLLVLQLIELLLCLIQLRLRLGQVGCLLFKNIELLLSAIELLVALEIVQLLVALQFLDLLVLFGFVEILSDLLGLFSRAHNASRLQKYAATNRQQQTAMAFHIEKLSLALRNCKQGQRSKQRQIPDLDVGGSSAGALTVASVEI